jgi:hypothetical protein
MNAMTETPRQLAPAPIDTSAAALIFSPERMAALVSVAEAMASGLATVPHHLRKNKGDCLAVCLQATQWRMTPFAVAQKTHIVNGTLGYEGQLVNAVINTMAPTKDRINYEWFGEWSRVMGKFEERTSKKKVDDDTGQPLKYRVPAWGIKDEEGLGIRVWATMKGEDTPRVLELLLVQCRVRNSPLWADDPRQQIAYLAVKRWGRLHCPDVMLGVYTPDELQETREPRDMGDVEVVEPLKPQPITADELAAWKAESSKGTAASRAWLASFPGPRRRLVSDAIKAEVWAIAEAAEKRRTVDAGSASAATADGTQAAGAPAPVDDPFVTELKAAEEAARRAGEGVMGRAQGGAA